jgi:hypothetical protein
MEQKNGYIDDSNNCNPLIGSAGCNNNRIQTDAVATGDPTGRNARGESLQLLQQPNCFSSCKRAPSNILHNISSSTSPISTAIDSSEADADVTQTKKKRRRKKSKKPPSDRPKRSVSAYNIFFHLERERLHLLGVQDVHMLATATNDHTSWTEQEVADAATLLSDRPKRKHIKVPGGSIAFTDLSRFIATKWKYTPVSVRTRIEQRAALLLEVYLRNVQDWKASQHMQQQPHHSETKQPHNNILRVEDIEANETQKKPASKSVPNPSLQLSETRCNSEEMHADMRTSIDSNQTIQHKRKSTASPLSQFRSSPTTEDTNEVNRSHKSTTINEAQAVVAGNGNDLLSRSQMKSFDHDDFSRVKK